MAFWAAAGVLVMGAVACQKKGAPGPAPVVHKGPLPPVATPPRAPVVFADKPAKLADIPEGMEPGEAVFSADGRHVAFVTSKDGAAWVTRDGQQGRPHESIRSLVLREGQGTVAYVGLRGVKEAVVVDWQEGVRYTAVGTPRFAADGRVVHSARRGEAWLLVSGGRERPVATATDPEPFLSPDGRRVVFAEQSTELAPAGLRSCSLDLTDCVSGPPHDGVAQLTSDPWGVRLAYVAGRAGQEMVAVVDLDQPGLVERNLGTYDNVALIGLSEGGQHVAFLARRGAQQLLVKDGEEVPLPETDSPMQLVVSRTGRVLVSAVKGAQAVVLVDGAPQAAGGKSVDHPSFSDDGAAHAWVADDGASGALVVNGARGPAMDKVVTPRFLPGGAGLVYRARRDGQRFVVQADAQGKTVREHPRYLAVFDVAVSPDGKTIGYGVRDGRAYWWKVERVEGAGARR